MSACIGVDKIYINRLPRGLQAGPLDLVLVVGMEQPSKPGQAEEPRSRRWLRPRQPLAWLAPRGSEGERAEIRAEVALGMLADPLLFWRWPSGLAGVPEEFRLKAALVHSRRGRSYSLLCRTGPLLPLSWAAASKDLWFCSPIKQSHLQNNCKGPSKAEGLLLCSGLALVTQRNHKGDGGEAWAAAALPGLPALASLPQL